MKNSRSVALVLLAALAAGTGYWYWRQSREAAAPVKASPPVPVVVASAELRDLPVIFEAVGRAEAYATVSLRARVDGQVASLHFTEGQGVRQGDELIRLDAADFESRLRQAEAGVARDEAQLAKARADTARYQALRERNFVSDEKVNEMRAAEKTLAATVLADRAAVDLARSQLSYTRIRAPFDGVVGAKLVFPGAAVKANDTVLLVINRVRPLYASFALPEKYLPALRRRQAEAGAACRGEGCLPVTVGLPGESRRPLAGRLRFVDNAVDAATGTIQLKAVLDNRDGALTPGQFLNLGLQLDNLANAVVVPNEAVQQGPQGAFVFRVDGHDKVAPRPVVVAARHAGLTAVAEGLAAGDRVVTDGQSRLTPGAAVAIRPVRPPAAAAK